MRAREEPLGRPRHLVGRIILKWTFREMGCRGMDWIDLAKGRDRVDGTCDCGNGPSGSIKMRVIS